MKAFQLFVSMPVMNFFAASIGVDAAQPVVNIGETINKSNKITTPLLFRFKIRPNTETAPPESQIIYQPTQIT